MLPGCAEAGREQGTENREQGTGRGNREQGVGNREQGNPRGRGAERRSPSTRPRRDGDGSGRPFESPSRTSGQALRANGGEEWCDGSARSYESLPPRRSYGRTSGVGHFATGTGRAGVGRRFESGLQRVGRLGERRVGRLGDLVGRRGFGVQGDGIRRVRLI